MSACQNFGARILNLCCVFALFSDCYDWIDTRHPDITDKLILPNGIPETLDNLITKITTTFGLKGNIRLQYMHQDLGSNFFNLKSMAELQDLEAVSVIIRS